MSMSEEDLRALSEARGRQVTPPYPSNPIQVLFMKLVAVMKPTLVNLYR
jgi:hypothetical protein